MGLSSEKLLIEAPVNGGRNYNGCKSLCNSDVTQSYQTVAVVKSDYMLGYLVYLRLPRR